MRPVQWPILVFLVLSVPLIGKAGDCEEQRRSNHKTNPLPEGAVARLKAQPSRRNDIPETENGRAVITLAFSPDGKTLAACLGDFDDRIRCWDVETRKAVGSLRLIPEHSRELRVPSSFTSPRLEFSADGKTLSAGFSVGTSEKGNVSCFDVIKQWDLSTGKALREVRGGKDEPLTVVRDADGILLGVAIRDGQLRTWDLVTGKKRFAWRMRKVIRGFNAHWLFKAFSANAKVIVTSTYLINGLQGIGRNLACGLQWFGTNLACHEASRGRILCDIGDIRLDLDSPVALSPDGRTIAIGDPYQGRIQLWETQTGRKIFPKGNDLEEPTPLPRVPALKGGIACLAFSPDGKTLAIAGPSGRISLLETITAKERRHFTGQHGPIHSLVFSSDGRLLASGGKDGIVFLWDVKPGALSARADNARLSPEQLQSLWDRLASEDASRAYHAIDRMRTVPQQAVPFLKQRLPILSDKDYRQILHLIAELDSEQFTIRAKAEKALKKRGCPALSVLSGVLTKKPALEVRRRVESVVADIRKSRSKMLTPEQIRYVRAVEVLEHCDTAEAKQTLQLLSERGSDPCLWQEAQEASRRLAKRAGKAH